MDHTKKIMSSLLILIILFTGCIEYEETLIIKVNGGGSITMVYGMPAEMAKGDDTFSADKIKNDLTGIDGVSVISTKDFEKDGLKWVETNARFTSLENLGNIKNDQLPGFAGVMTFTDHNNGSYTFTKVLGEEPKQTKSANDKDMMMMKNMIGDVTWNYGITFPVKIIDAMADKGDVQAEGKKLSWSVPLIDFIGGQATLTVNLGRSGKLAPLPVLQTVILKNGEKIRGEVMSLNKKSCIIKVGKKRERIDRDTIHSIEF